MKLPGFPENVIFLNGLHGSFFEGGDEFQLENGRGLDEVLGSKASGCSWPECEHHKIDLKMDLKKDYCVASWCLCLPAANDRHHN